ncbi:MAG: thermonuclease family protein [Maricaulaceae bacterium]
MSLLLGSVFLLGGAEKSMTDAKLTKGETETVREIVDGDTLFLASGLKVRLSGMQSPKLSLGREHVTDWPLGHEAKAALIELALDKRVTLYYDGERRDRYGRALAQLFKGGDDSGLYLQEEMLRRGLARVYTWPDTFQDSERLLTAEQEARVDKRGIWALDYYDIRSPEPNVLAQDVDSFQIVEGIVTSVADIRGRTYLNFGADYKTDFTVVIDAENRKSFEGEAYNLLELEGAKVRVRGWIELKNGPSIWMTHSTQLEVLD